jgi:1,4-dihydroxy-2-naphthoyl-CoA hydrolase
MHSGRSTIVVQTELRDDTGRLVGLTNQTQAVLS